MTAPYSIGRHGRVVLTYRGQKINLPDITQFQSQQQTNDINTSPNNGENDPASIPNGWAGSMTFNRTNNALDVLINDAETSFYANGSIDRATIQHTITEPDGSTSIWEYRKCAIKMGSAGSWQGDGLVSQSMSFTAARRVRLQ